MADILKCLRHKFETFEKRFLQMMTGGDLHIKDSDDCFTAYNLEVLCVCTVSIKCNEFILQQSVRLVIIAMQPNS